MAEKITLDSLIEQIELYIQYAVTENERVQAKSLVGKYRSHLFVLELLREFYSSLPDVCDDGVVRIVEVARRQGIFLFGALTRSTGYLYAISFEKVVLLGECGQEIDEEIKNFFLGEDGGTNSKWDISFDGLKQLDDVQVDESNSFCPICGVAEGEYHHMGCVVEVCPWCDGQLCSCNCRFEKLEVDEIDSDDLLEELLELLEEKGRIPYVPAQAPGYPGTSDGLDKIE